MKSIIKYKIIYNNKINKLLFLEQVIFKKYIKISITIVKYIIKIKKLAKKSN